MAAGRRIPRVVVAFALAAGAVVSLSVASRPLNAAAHVGREGPLIVTNPIWIDDSRGFEVLERTDDRIDLLVVDRSGHTVDAALFPQAIPIPQIAERVTAVRIRFDADTVADPTRPPPVLVYGFYRFGTEVTGCDAGRPGAVLVCVGFSQAEPGKILDPDAIRGVFADLPNMVGEVSAVLDVLAARPDVFPPVTSRRVVFTGYSLGAMVGHLMAHPQLRDQRIRAVVTRTGFAPDWIPAFRDAATWAGAPRQLMVNVYRDAVTPYDGGRRTYQLAQKFGRVTFLTVGGTDHTVRCRAALDYEDAWVDARLGIAADLAAASAEVDTSPCVRVGLRKRGSVGDGRFDFLRPGSAG